MNFLLRLSEWFQSPTGVFRKTAWLLLCLCVGCTVLVPVAPPLGLLALPALFLSLLLAFITAVVRLLSR
ncbi:MAG: hypothetical protein FD161_1315 [Limisphaerales bacterium]|nr:MAG: hypothetical protein FD161_1315 [Limisphaerales bacterium]KAG0509625.1 MAG: hypothetical protein E1N63_1234 [Limisphaerales bacterium]TXT49769.1 MAG: hypothetical protein FD140_2795 [Limisphaerales bacterium]